MKMSLPSYAVGPVVHELHNAGVDSLLLIRTGPGWMVEFMTRIEPDTLKSLVRLGAVIVP